MITVEQFNNQFPVGSKVRANVMPGERLVTVTGAAKQMHDDTVFFGSYDLVHNVPVKLEWVDIKIKNYPIKDEHRTHYFMFPVINKHTAMQYWRGADVLHRGYTNPFHTPVRNDFESFETCAAACKIHNHWLIESNNLKPGTDDKVINYSMGMYKGYLDLNECKTESEATNG